MIGKGPWKNEKVLCCLTLVRLVAKMQECSFLDSVRGNMVMAVPDVLKHVSHNKQCLMLFDLCPDS